MPQWIILLAKALTYTSNLSALPAIYIGANKKNVLWYYVLCSLVCDITSFVLKLMNIGFVWVSDSFFVLEFICLGLFFINATLKDRVRRTAVVCLLILAVLFVVHTLSVVGLSKVNYVGTSYLYTSYILLALWGFYKLITEMTNESLEKSPLFIACVAILIYASGSFIILLYENELLQTEPKFIKYAWVFIRNPLNIVKNLLISYLLWLNIKSE